MQHLKRWTVTRYQLVPESELHSTIVTWAWDACRTSPVVTTVSSMDNWWIKTRYNWASMRSRRLDICRRAFLRFSSRFIKNAKNSNNKIKVITASATTRTTTKKNNKANIQRNKIQIQIPDCLFIIFCTITRCSIHYNIFQEQEGKGNSKLHESWMVKCAHWPKKLSQKGFVLFIFSLARVIN